MKRLGPQRCAMCYFRGHIWGWPCNDDFGEAVMGQGKRVGQPQDVHLKNLRSILGNRIRFRMDMEDYERIGEEVDLSAKTVQKYVGIIRHRLHMKNPTRRAPI